MHARADTALHNSALLLVLQATLAVVAAVVVLSHSSAVLRETSWDT
jgi:hypothetical protein